jgi:hypothetical protein
MYLMPVTEEVDVLINVVPLIESTGFYPLLHRGQGRIGSPIRTPWLMDDRFPYAHDGDRKPPFAETIHWSVLLAKKGDAMTQADCLLFLAILKCACGVPRFPPGFDL